MNEHSCKSAEGGPQVNITIWTAYATTKKSPLPRSLKKKGREALCMRYTTRIFQSRTCIGETKNFRERIHRDGNSDQRSQFWSWVRRSHWTLRSKGPPDFIDFKKIRTLTVETNPRQNLFLEPWHVRTPPENTYRSLGSFTSASVNGCRDITKRLRNA